ncbi:MAG: ferrochelatase, partial [Acidimicrobiales bacterium]
MPEPDSPTGPVGVLVMAYGTPATPDDVESYYTHVRRGRPPSAEQLADLRRRYDAIGGTSPLLERTRDQVEGVARELGPGFLVGLGMKHAAPFVEEGVGALAKLGVQRLVGVVLAPHFSELSIGEYCDRVARTGAEHGVDVATVRSWHLAAPYVDLLAGGVTEAVAGLDLPASDVEVLFTAHSLPARILQTADPYPEQLAATASVVADLAGIERWRVAWQSAGRTPEPWIGPDILEVLRQLAGEGRTRGVVVCPAGFVSDHLEVLYDLD